MGVRQASGVTYLHSDHLGSVSVATNGSGAVVSQQSFDPWGKVRSGSVVSGDDSLPSRRRRCASSRAYSIRPYAMDSWCIQ
jgi:hypothetical protein